MRDAHEEDLEDEDEPAYAADYDDADDDDDDAGDGAREGRYLDGPAFADDGRLDDAQKAEVAMFGEMARELVAADKTFMRHHDIPPEPPPAPKPPKPKVYKEPDETSKAWISSPRMTRTDVGLRLAMHLLSNKLVVSDITLALTGSEMTGKRKKPVFPVVDFLARYGFTKHVDASDHWPNVYMKEGVAHRLVLCEKPDEAPMVAQLRRGVRLLVDVMGGPLTGTRSNREHVQLRTAIGRAMTLAEARSEDVVVIAMPRSRRFRELSREWRDAPRMIEARLRLALVDRNGNVDGLGVLRGRKG